MTTTTWWSADYPAQYYARSNTDVTINGFPAVAWVDVSLYSAAPSWLPVASDMIAMTAAEWEARPVGMQCYIDSGKWVTYTPAATLASQTEALAVIAAEKQSAGIYYTPSAGKTSYLFGTDDASQVKMLTAYVSANADLWVDGTVWKTLSGTFVAMSSADVIALAKASQTYVAACYARESALQTALASDLSTDLTTGWPSQGTST